MGKGLFQQDKARPYPNGLKFKFFEPPMQHDSQQNIFYGVKLDDRKIFTSSVRTRALTRIVL